MLTAAGCRARRDRLWDRLGTTEGTLVLADPIHLRYLANVWVDPISLGGDFGAFLVLSKDGTSTLYHDNRLPKTVEQAHVDRREVISWYDGQSPGRGPRRLVLLEALRQVGSRIHDSLADPMGPRLIEILADLRRRKDPDEVEVLRRCMRATEAGQQWARQHLRAGLTELQVYEGVAAASVEAAGMPAIVYGDFAVSPGSARRGGPPTQQMLKNGDMFILDYAVILWGYRSDFTNTLVVGGEPTAEQQRLYDRCREALAAGEAELKAGAACQAVYDAVRGAFARAGMADSFPHHAGHGLGLCHPEAPYLVRHSNETLLAGDVVTVDPGLYVDGVGGIRIEHNYLVTEQGFDRLSNHEIVLY